MSFARHLLLHRRHYLGSAAGIAFGVSLPIEWPLPLRIIVGWDAATVVFLILLLVMMATSSHEQMRKRSEAEDDGRWVLLALTTTAALASLFAIGMVLAGVKEMPANERPIYLGFGGTTIFLSWLMVHSLYAVHYAYDHYREIGTAPNDETPRGLDFPGTSDPDYWDFCYFSFTVGMTAQTSDITINGSHLRRLTLIHSIVSFCFNTVLVALTVNIAAGLL